MEILDIGKLEAYTNAEQEARVPSLQGTESRNNGCRRGARGPTRTVTMITMLGRLKTVIPCRDTQTSCC
jgi:hypothetical protein